MKICYVCHQTEQDVPFYSNVRGKCVTCHRAYMKSRPRKNAFAPSKSVTNEALVWLHQRGLFATPGTYGVDILIEGLIRVMVKGYDKGDASFRSDGEAYRYTTTPNQQKGLNVDVIMLEGEDGWHIFSSDYSGFYDDNGKVKSCFLHYTGNNKAFHVKGQRITREDWEFARNNLEAIDMARDQITTMLMNGTFEIEKHFGKGCHNKIQTEVLS